MYLGQVRRVEKRKPAKCDHCGEEISVGEPCFVVVRAAKSKKDKKYCWTIYVHLGCFSDWSGKTVEKRKAYTAERKGGRPLGSPVKDLAKSNPEQALERHKLIREQARLLRYLLVAEDDDRICDLVGKVNAIQKRLVGILGFQVKKFNRRSAESSRILNEKIAYARDIERRRVMDERRQRPLQPRPAPVEKSP
ncbi:unnamed protein product, partial [marine sediment metagenome]